MDISSVKSRHIILRPFVEQDIETIFKWKCSTSDLHLWFKRPEILSFREFLDDFNTFARNYCHILQMICTPTSDVPLGMTYSYQADYLNGYVYVCTFLDESNRDYLYGAEASLIFVDYLFSYYTFRKAYAEVYEHNVDSINNLRKGGWIQEGCLKKHIWRLGEYRDMLIFALYREHFYQKYSDLLCKVKTV
jgi:RimJ/RimL family protein N-acetyltransferase